jgi:hypothetical protein
MSGGGKIDNGKPAMTEGGAGLAIDPDAGVVRSAMPHAAGHFAGDGVRVIAADRRSVNEAGDAAHASYPFDPDLLLRIFITRSSALQQSCCNRLEILGWK